MRISTGSVAVVSLVLVGACAPPAESPAVPVARAGVSRWRRLFQAEQGRVTRTLPPSPAASGAQPERRGMQC